MLRFLICLIVVAGCNSDSGVDDNPDADTRATASFSWTLVDAGNNPISCAMANAQNVVINFVPPNGGSFVTDVTGCVLGNYQTLPVNSGVYDVVIDVKTGAGMVLDSETFSATTLNPSTDTPLGSIVFNIP